MKAIKIFQVLVFGMALMLCTSLDAQVQKSQPGNKNAQAQKQPVEQVQKSQPAATASQAPKSQPAQQVSKSQPQASKASKAKKSTVGKGFRTTVAVKLRKNASSNSTSVKYKNGKIVVIPKGGSIKYVKTSGNFYKVTYKGYTGYIAKKYTTGR
jgi:hypothetical protein